MIYGLRQFGGIGIQRKNLPRYLAGGCRTCGGKYKKKRRSRRGPRIRGRGGGLLGALGGALWRMTPFGMIGSRKVLIGSKQAWYYEDAEEGLVV